MEEKPDYIERVVVRRKNRLMERLEKIKHHICMQLTRVTVTQMNILSLAM